ncbi:isopenicillin N synthase family oxygenase [Rhodobacter sp. NTK016B]|uniref:isopenicillin N synthase family dioxygenase n=1 Tax=Rhodobacter sp. NTK016B TaxID=2759676 RepID=UPI001A9070CE|nr:2-oxoglutarate and iron-dependent oxygenase domain-containing protein [Rhodobacter sp. NTK016B]MBN8291760.1 isopenicillin N synthase family oxygenase [Rhodobacter sp. NTK016B]
MNESLSRAIPRIDVAALFAGDAQARAELRRGAEEVGFLTLVNTPIPAARVRDVIAAYRAFFALPLAEKGAVDMARTGSNRGWGAPLSEQVDPGANPDYKEVFDMGFAVPGSTRPVHAPNLWPARPEGFRETLEAYYAEAQALSLRLLSAIAGAIGAKEDWFDDKFEHPMALLRGNFYPERPDWAGDRDFGIGAHTDYGCLTLLANDGVPGLEVKMRNGEWQAVAAEPGGFVVNFGEMLESWSGGRIRATLHRVVGSASERISVPLFFNPSPDVNVAPPGSGQVIRAEDHLQKRFNETYLHLQKA